MDGRRIREYLSAPPPRGEGEEAFDFALDRVLPKYVRVIMVVVPIVMFFAIVPVVVLLLATDRFDDAIKLELGERTVVEGTVTDVDERTSPKGRTTTVVSFSYAPPGGGSPLKGVCYGDVELSSGQVVKVECLPDAPEIARVEGCRVNRVPLYLPLAIFVVYAIVTSLLFFVIFQRKRVLGRFLTHGEMGGGTLRKASPLGRGGMNVVVDYQCRGQIVAGRILIGGGFKNVQRLKALVKAAKPVTILYLPEAPKQVFIVDLLDD